MLTPSSPTITATPLAFVDAPTSPLADRRRANLRRATEEAGGACLAKALLRLRGGLALSDPDVADALRLDDGQREMVRAIRRSKQQALRAAARRAEMCGGRRGLQDSLRGIETAAREQLLNVLTVEQKQMVQRFLDGPSLDTAAG